MYQCDNCGKTFEKKSALSRHSKRSKICNGIKRLPKTESNLEKELKKFGIIIVHENK